MRGVRNGWKLHGILQALVVGLLGHDHDYYMMFLCGVTVMEGSREGSTGRSGDCSGELRSDGSLPKCP